MKRRNILKSGVGALAGLLAGNVAAVAAGPTAASDQEKLKAVRQYFTAKRHLEECYRWNLECLRAMPEHFETEDYRERIETRPQYNVKAAKRAYHAAGARIANEFGEEYLLMANPIHREYGFTPEM